ncbi:MAG: hypothetical protein IT437_08360 [Phycisphaerales bacterium]|nr:hypothetical protein [Phycisphaerales bacterium]
MNPGVPTRLIAAIFALAAFVVAVAGGLGAGNPASQVLGVAIVSLIACYALGSIVGTVGEWAVHEHLKETIRAKAPDAGRAAAGSSAKSAPS